MDSCHYMDANTNNDSEKTSSSRNIKRVIGVTSSKGGVGKSFITCLLACELNRRGYKTGILDADLTASSIPLFFGLNGPIKMGPYSYLPLQTATGIEIISANLLVEDEQKVIIWKEALAGNVITQLYKEVEWGALDTLIIDLPPANSELNVTIMQSIPFNGVTIVSQPQEISARVVSKATRLFLEIGIPVIGIVENMAYTFYPDSDQKMMIFGPSHIEPLSFLLNVPLLARIPYKSENNKLCDTGKIEDVSYSESAGLYEAFMASLSEIEAQQKESLSLEDNRDNNYEDNHLSIDKQDEESPHTGGYFSDTVIQLIRNKDNLGSLDNPNAQGFFLGKCGDRMQIDLQIVNRRIINAKFMADGCGATLACGSMITKMACSKTLTQAKKIEPDELINALDGLPEDHLHCAELAVMTLREAVIDALEGPDYRIK